MDIGLSELLIILVILVLLFGIGRLGKIGAELGTAIREFRQALQGGDADEAKQGRADESDHGQQ